MGFLEKLIGGGEEDEKEEKDQGDEQDESSDEGTDDEKEELEKPINDIDKLKSTIIDAYLTKLNKKDFVKGLIRGKKMKAQAREYILEPKQEEEGMDLGGLNLPPEVSKFAAVLKGSGSAFLPTMLKKFTGLDIGFDEEKELNPMKEFMSTATKDQLDALKSFITTWDGGDVAVLLAGTGTGVVAANTASESADMMNLRAEGVAKYFTILTGSTDVGVHNIQAQKTIEAMNASCTFFGKDLTVNKYMVKKLQEVEKEIKDSGINYPVTSAGGYNRRNISGGSSLSYHALGLALDINPATNPFVETSGGKIPTDIPKEFVDIFRKHGFVRGGNRGQEGRSDTYTADAMHFQFEDGEYLKEQMQLDNTYNVAA